MKTHRTHSPRLRRIARGLGTSLALACMLANMPAYAQNSGIKSIPMDTIALDQPDLGKLFNVAPKPILKGITKIAIPLFAVETAVKTGAGVRRESASGAVTQNVTYILDGVPQQAMQAAVDKLYDSLVLDLKNIGIEVVPMEQVMATAAYKSAAPNLTSPSKQEGGSAEAMVYSAKGSTLGLSNSRYIFNRNVSGGSVFSMLKAVGNVTSQVTDGGVAKGISDELSMPVMLVQIPLEFVEQSLATSGNSAFVTAEVHSNLRMSIAFNSFLSVGRSDEYSSHVLTSQLILSGTPVSSVKDTSSVAANVGLGLLSMMAGGKSSTRLTEKTAQAHPTLYVENVTDGVGKFNKIIVAAVKAMQ